MKKLARTLPLRSCLLPMVVGCAAEAETEAASTEDALASPSGAEVVGTLGIDVQAQGTTSRADGGYRAFAFDAMANTEYVAYVVATSDVDPMASILDANRRTLKRNDDRRASVKDAEIRFTATSYGTHYVAFRTKERRAAPVMESDVV